MRWVVFVLFVFVVYLETYFWMESIFAQTVLHCMGFLRSWERASKSTSTRPRFPVSSFHGQRQYLVSMTFKNHRKIEEKGKLWLTWPCGVTARTFTCGSNLNLWCRIAKPMMRIPSIFQQCKDTISVPMGGTDVELVWRSRELWAGSIGFGYSAGPYSGIVYFTSGNPHYLGISAGNSYRNYPVRCAHNPPPCLPFFYDFLDYFFSGVLDSGWSDSWFFVILEALGLILEAWGPIFKISWIFMILETFPTRKTSPLLRSLFDQEPPFSSVVSRCFF